MQQFSSPSTGPSISSMQPPQTNSVATLPKQAPSTQPSTADNRSFGHFLRIWLLTVLFLSASVAGVNWLINPYGIYRWAPTISGFNQVKPARETRDRLVKAVDIIQQRPQHLIAGSSRTKQGINPDHGAIDKKAYNAGLNGVSSYELRRYVEHAIATHPDLKQVTIGIDFFMFNLAANIPPDSIDILMDGYQSEDNVLSGFAEHRLERSHLSPNDVLATTLSIDAIINSYETVRDSRQSPNKPPDDKSGFAPHETATDNNTEWRFNHDLSIFFSRHDRFVLSPDTLEDFAKIVQLCKEKDIELSVFISPSHAVQWEAIAQTGEWETFEQWKRELVALTPVWDFSGYSSVTTEQVRPGMDYYRDNSHYQPIVGNWVLSRMFGSAAQQQPVPDDFGVLLTPNTIEPHLATLRRDRQQWRSQNTSTLEWISDVRQKAIADNSATSASVPAADSDTP